jgi:pSer/pThr/pTyr-binding forkhead associated (FHA) protein
MHTLSHYAVEYLRTRTLRLEYPVLVWRSAPLEKPTEWQTQAPNQRTRPIVGDPLIFEIVKRNQSGNAVGMGVTLGRIDNNDVCIEDESVSRVHAYFQQVPATEGAEQRWTIADAHSRNGSHVNGARILPRMGVALKGGDQLRLGDVDLSYLDPIGFEKLLEETTAQDPPSQVAGH